mmetsp:Transcript_24469/g.79085  ORF Transcript_24469/g.79085 Transcript_24469/m.79085 type:complete len:97 (+) Transcript_24469:82-372(+)
MHLSRRRPHRSARVEAHHSLPRRQVVPRERAERQPFAWPPLVHHPNHVPWDQYSAPMAQPQENPADLPGFVHSAESGLRHVLRDAFAASVARQMDR